MIGKEKIQVFRKAFKKANHGKCSLPNRFDFDKINVVDFYTDGMRGGMNSSFLFRKNLQDEYFLEVISRDDNAKRHMVILADGSTHELKNYLPELGREITLAIESEKLSIVEKRTFALKIDQKPQVARK